MSSSSDSDSSDSELPPPLPSSAPPPSKTKAEPAAAAAATDAADDAATPSSSSSAAAAAAAPSSSSSSSSRRSVRRGESQRKKGARSRRHLKMEEDNEVGAKEDDDDDDDDGAASASASAAAAAAPSTGGSARNRGALQRGGLQRTESSIIYREKAEADGREMIKVYLMDGSYKALRLDPSEVTVEALWEAMAEKLLLTEESAQAFFLWGVNGNFELLLFTHQKIAEVRRDWPQFEERYNPARSKGIGGTISRGIRRSASKAAVATTGQSSRNLTGGSTRNLTGGSTRNLRADADKEIQAALASARLGGDEDWGFKIMLRTTSVLPLEDECRMTDDGAVSLFYMQAVYNVITSNYPCDVATAVDLGALQLQVSCGDYDPGRHKEGYLDPILEQYVPEHLVKRLKRVEWEKALLDAYKTHAGETENDARLAYLALTRRWPYYGSTFFYGKYEPLDSMFAQEFEGLVRVGVNANGLHIIDPKLMKVVSCSFEQLITWNSDRGLFWFEMGSSTSLSGKSGLFGSKRVKTQTHQIKSSNAELINDLLHDWMAEVDRLDALRQSNLHQDDAGAAAAGGSSGSSSSSRRRSSKKSGGSSSGGGSGSAGGTSGRRKSRSAAAGAAGKKR